MKTRRSILLGAAFVLPILFLDCTLADTVIYMESGRQTTVGKGFETKDRFQLFIVYDTAVQRPIGAIRFTSSSWSGFKYYSILTNMMDYNVVRGVGGPKGNETLWFRTMTSTNNTGRFFTYAYFARGRDSTLDLGNGNTADLPRTMKVITREADDTLGAPYVSEAISVLQFQREETRIANTSAETLDQTLERVRLRLEAKGYVRTPG